MAGGGEVPEVNIGPEVFWRFALEEFGASVGFPAATVRLLSDEQVVAAGEALALAFLRPLADLLGPLVFRAVQAYREAEHEAKYRPAGAEGSD